MTAELKTLPRHHDTTRGRTATTTRDPSQRPLSGRPTLAEAALAGLGLLTKLGAALLAVGVAFTTAAQAGTVTVTFEEVGSNVQATISGSLALTDLDFLFEEFADSAYVDPSEPAFYSLTFSQFLQDNVGRWQASTVSGPESFGGGSLTGADSLSGNPFAFVVNPGEEGDYATLWLPLGYTADQPLSGTTTWNNTTFAGLGITPGTYTWSLGGTDSVVIQAVPEPATCMMALAGLGFAGYSMFRRRKRA
jgi:hypothetical protein